MICAQKLTSSQLNLLHGTKQKRVGLMNKLKTKTEMLRRNGSQGDREYSSFQNGNGSSLEIDRSHSNEDYHQAVAAVICKHPSDWNDLLEDPIPLSH